MSAYEQARPGWLERTFLYTFGLSGLILLLHSSSLYINRDTQFILISPPRPYYGRPSRPTTPRPQPMKINIDMEKHTKLMEERVNTMRDTCEDYGDDIKFPKRIGSDHSLMWDLKHHLVYCPIYKVASGTWTTNFLRLSSFNSDLPKWQRFSKLHNASESVSRKLFPPPKGKKKQLATLKDSTKFLVVRHPFDRIMSAFKGKIANPNAKPRFYRKLQKEIKVKYSKNAKEIADEIPPSFEEYWRYLTDITSGLVHPRDWRDVDCVQAFYSVCVPCDVEYDVIIKLETHDEDTEYLIRKNQLTELSEPFTMWKHNSKAENQIGDYDYYVYDDPKMNPIQMTKVQTPSESPTSNLASEMEADSERKVSEKEEYKKLLFSQLTKGQVQKLYENYKVDFDMFDYNIAEFLEYAKN
eukprot:TRINITY_DN5916_c0_g1_i1.p1 TRINITY_DN5916_c0_g1~~TRINITY_DN5916_c0_g1_i1.p1  ORF type:complete len:411 (-),score=111.14 TRINITY_DN5916_c0_g1_i1:141-1373(-)